MKNVPADQQLDLKLQFQNSSVKLKKLEARLSDFCKQTGMKRDRFREQVFSTDTENGIKRWTKSTSAKAVWGNRKALTKQAENDIILPNDTKVEETHLRHIGKIDIEKYKKVTPHEIITDEVILTNERLDHIRQRRGDAFVDQYADRFAEIVQDPDYIFKDKAENTALVSKQYTNDGKCVNIALKLVVKGDNPDYKNSIITAVGESEKRFRQRLRNNKPVYSKTLDKNE